MFLFHYHGKDGLLTYTSEINLRYLRGARKLYLSGNALKQLDTVVDFFALEYLELCAVQIEELPSDFSRQVPNLGALYLSHNYLRDIHPLRKLRHLQKLVLIDNRLQSLSETVETIRTLEKLHHLDLRLVCKKCLETAEYSFYA